jgi:hypothetical protein
MNCRLILYVGFAVDRSKERHHPSGVLSISLFLEEIFDRIRAGVVVRTYVIYLPARLQLEFALMLLFDAVFDTREI